ncbi:MAG TPA: DUF1345 domain-containing protein [Ignavibacteriaceae bacterium]|nr:DUF1345 domain-containing protein [Ignavibacteriaceae bacterium]
MAISNLITFCWDVFAVVNLVLSWISISTTEIHQIRQTAKKQDSSRTTIFAFVIIAACMSLFAVGFVLVSGKGLPGSILTLHILLAVVSVVCSWFLIHTLFALRYAHIYYGDKNIRDKKDNDGGLDFPEEKEPGYMDFAYFSFVVGMTCQVSDVQVTSKRMRRLVLLHGILSFAFNTAILALIINIIASLI